MPRQIRVLSKTNIYHVMLRGNERKNIFIDDEDRLRFINILKIKAKESGFLLYGYCLMDNHGSIKGGLLRLIFSLIDFTFVRSLVADCYSKVGGDCHDPVTLLLLEVIKIWEKKYVYYPEFIDDLKDMDKGAQYRYYTGVDIDNVLTEATLHNFRDRIGEGKLQEVINFLVQIFNIVGIIYN